MGQQSRLLLLHLLDPPSGSLTPHLEELLRCPHSCCDVHYWLLTCTVCVCVCVCVCVFSSITKGLNFCMTKLRGRNSPHVFQLVLMSSRLFFHLLFYLVVLGLCCCMAFLELRWVDASHCSGFSCCWAQALGLEAFSSCSFQAVEHTIVVMHGLSCSIWDLLDQGSNPCLLH